MNRWTVVLAATLALVLVALSCSGGGGNPVAPTTERVTTDGDPTTCGGAQTHLWGYWDVYIDIENQTVEAVYRRSLVFAANVVTFVNSPPTNLGFHINDTPIGPGYMDVDIDVTITHPFPGLHEYDGYDVRGVFMGDGSGTLSYNADLDHPVLGMDQYMLDDPVNADGGGPDGYTRWFNRPEFSTPGLFGYTQGKFATPGYAGDATLCPYKYFADGLGAKEDLWDFLTTTNDDGVFSAGAKNTRNYYLRFPDAKGIRYGYAIVANWEATDVHPSNAPEAVGCEVVDNSTVYYIDSATYGGDVILDISLFGWEHQPSMIFIESPVLSDVASFDPSIIAIGGGEHYTTYRTEVACALNAVDVFPQDIHPQPIWVIAEYDTFDYSNDTGVPNAAGADALAAVFLHELTILDAYIEVTSPNGGEEWAYGSDEEITWSSQNVTGTVFIENSKDNFVSDINTIATNEANDGSFMWDPVPCDVSDTVRVRVSSTDDPRVNDKSGDDFSIVDFGWARTWGSAWPLADSGWGVATDDSGNVYVTGEFWTTADFDPGDGEDIHTSLGNADAFLSKFDAAGNFEWARTWGGVANECGWGVGTDGSGDVYVAGSFYFIIDFDPGEGEELHAAHGMTDVFLSKFDSSGNFEWARTWGSIQEDYGRGVAADGAGNVYVAGEFRLDVDFDPDGGDVHHSHGYNDVFLSKFDSSGNFQWARTWGGAVSDLGWGVAADGSGNAYVAGYFQDTVDFDPDGGDPHTSNGSWDVFLSKFDSSGNFGWARTWGGAIGEEGRGVAADGSGNVYVTGYFWDTVDFDPGGGSDPHTSNGDRDVFLSKFDSFGNFGWARTWGGSSSDVSWGVAADGSEHAYVTGSFWFTVDFDPGAGEDLHTSSDADPFLSKFDSSGDFVWARTWGAPAADECLGVAANSSENVYTTGRFPGTADFAPTDPPCNEDPDEHTSNGGYDVFLTKHLSGGCW